MNWKFFWDQTKLETRASATDLAVDTLIARASGTASDIMAVAAVETAAGLWGRAFASAKVEPDGNRQTAGITPSVLEMIGRQLIRRGEVVFQIVVSAGAVRLIPAASFSVMGGPEGWTYEIHVSAADAIFYADTGSICRASFPICHGPLKNLGGEGRQFLWLP